MKDVGTTEVALIMLAFALLMLWLGGELADAWGLFPTVLTLALGATAIAHRNGIYVAAVIVVATTITALAVVGSARVFAWRPSVSSSHVRVTATSSGVTAAVLAFAAELDMSSIMLVALMVALTTVVTVRRVASERDKR